MRTLQICSSNKVLMRDMYSFANRHFTIRHQIKNSRKFEISHKWMKTYLNEQIFFFDNRSKIKVPFLLQNNTKFTLV